ncbi:MAG: oligosaccharide repeat unit polymerase, partial [Caulobacteraceae bacterium]
MRFHPAVLMLMTWAIAFAIFFTLPFMLVGRVMTPYGYLILSIFLVAYCGGALMATRPRKQRPRDRSVVIDWKRADQVLIIVCMISMLAFLIDIQGRNIFDLAGAYAERSSRATALLQGAESDSSIWFQIGFLTYPASFIYLVREIAFRARPKLWRVALFGAAPVVLATLTMGGRGPLFFVVAYAVYA